MLAHQLAVGVLADAEAMSRLLTQCRDDNVNDNATVLINYDEGNAHNEVDRRTLLVRVREVSRGLCKWLLVIYPTDVATHVFFRGRAIPSAAEGQQGCRGWRHVRMVHESLGLVASLASQHSPRRVL